MNGITVLQSDSPQAPPWPVDGEFDPDATGTFIRAPEFEPSACVMFYRNPLNDDRWYRHQDTGRLWLSIEKGSLAPLASSKSITDMANYSKQFKLGETLFTKAFGSSFVPFLRAARSRYGINSTRHPLVMELLSQLRMTPGHVDLEATTWWAKMVGEEQCDEETLAICVKRVVEARHVLTAAGFSSTDETRYSASDHAA